MTAPLSRRSFGVARGQRDEATCCDCRRSSFVPARTVPAGMEEQAVWAARGRQDSHDRGRLAASRGTPHALPQAGRDPHTTSRRGYRAVGQTASPHRQSEDERTVDAWLWMLRLRDPALTRRGLFAVFDDGGRERERHAGIEPHLRASPVLGPRLWIRNESATR